MESFGGLKLTINVVSAKDLIFKPRECNLYVEFRYAGKQHKTRALSNTVSPCWGELFHIELIDSDNSEIEFRVLDKVLILSDTLIGVCKIPISTLRKKTAFEQTYDIEQYIQETPIPSNGNSGSSNNSGNNSPNGPFSKSTLSSSPPPLIHTQVYHHLAPTIKIKVVGKLKLSFTFDQYKPSTKKVDVSDEWFLLDTPPTNSSQVPLPVTNHMKNNGSIATTTTTNTTTTTTTTTNSTNNHSNKSPRSTGISQIIQPLHFPTINSPIYNNISLHNSNNGNGSINGNNFTPRESPKLVHNLSNSHLASMIGNFGDLDLETIELLKATLREESVYSGKDDDKFLSHCNLCNSKATPDNPLFLMEECIHNFCKNCLFQGILKQIRQPTNGTDINCISSECNQKIHQEILKIILGHNEYENYLNRMLEVALKSNPNMIKCPDEKCGFIFERASGTHHRESNNNNSTGIKLYDGRTMSEEAAKHRLEYRFRCTKCSIEFCSSCYSTPYHDYYTCDKYKEYLQSRKCRFCSARIKASPTTSPMLVSANGASLSHGLSDVCENEECQAKMQVSCDKVHKKCSHPCIGVKDEKTCLPCMNEACYTANRYQNDDNELCNICWVESLNSAPTIQLGCGHFFHYQCVLRQLHKKQGPRILFNNIECGICKKQISHPILKEEIVPILDLKRRIQVKASERFQFEGLDKSKELEDKTSKYYKNPEAMALDRYVYYKCFKCQQPYFAGAARCDEGLDGYKEEELLCNSCLGVDKNGECKLHGVDYITWKCKFCCNEASYFCWNKTHFCTDCHTKQQKGDYLNKKPVEDIPRCPGPNKCPLKIPHPHPHVEELILGCSLCGLHYNTL